VSLAALIILDGWGYTRRRRGNAVRLARTPNFDELWRRHPRTLLAASGEDVGLPAGQMGNSEVGHLNLGAGRVVLQELPRIDRAIADGSFFTNPVLMQVVAAARGHRLHLLGLCSDGGVHSHLRHLLALLELARRAGHRDVVVHAVTDGRDTPPDSARGYLARLAGQRVATVIGRYYAMDRDRRWEREEAAYRALVLGEGERAPTAEAAVASAYARGETDEFIRPTVVGEPAPMADGDAVICFNFRADRMRQLTRVLFDPAFAAFARPRTPHLAAATFTPYDDEFPLPTAFPREPVADGLGAVVAAAGLRQLRIAETEKYAHVTYFFNGGDERQLPGEERILVPSPKVPTYDRKPEMSAPEVAERACAAIAAAAGAAGAGRGGCPAAPDTGGGLSLVVLNFANPDMVGHTGSLPAAVAACEAVDGCLGRVVAAVRARGGSCLILADHGNAEVMIDPVTGGPHTAHTTNPVPCILVTDRRVRLRAGGRLADAAPTLLRLLGLPQPDAMTGQPLMGGESR
jgi:2,3-bisphosphoglycerate-independent phosphoglycerate mutase